MAWPEKLNSEQLLEWLHNFTLIRAEVRRETTNKNQLWLMEKLPLRKIDLPTFSSDKSKVTEFSKLSFLSCPPIICKVKSDGNYTVLDGVYRFLAAKTIKEESIPAYIKYDNLYKTGNVLKTARDKIIK
jgi:hypothetical protein